MLNLAHSKFGLRGPENEKRVERISGVSLSAGVSQRIETGVPTHGESGDRYYSLPEVANAEIKLDGFQVPLELVYRWLSSTKHVRTLRSH